LKGWKLAQQEKENKNKEKGKEEKKLNTPG